MKSMKVLASVLLVFVFAVALNAQTNPDSPKFTLILKALKTEVTLGADIDIAITTTNISDEPLTFLFGNHGNVAVGYQYYVRDEKGAPLARKTEQRTVQLPNGGTWHIPTPPGKAMVGGIQPGKSIEEGSTISRAYPFDHSGKYTIQVSRKEPWSPNPIYSNIITITVLPAGTNSSTNQPAATPQ